MKGISAWILAALLLARTAAAEDTDSARKRASDARFEAGLKFHDAHREAEARIEFEQAYAIRPNAFVLFNLARAEEVTGDVTLAVRHYRMCVADPKAKEAVRDEATRRLEEIDARTAHVAIDAPAGATQITIDGVAVPPNDTGDVIVPAGTHVIKASLFDGPEQIAEITASAGEHVTARLHAARASAPAGANADVAGAPFPTGTTAKDAVTPSRTRTWIPIAVLGGVTVAAAAVAISFHLAADSADDDATRLRASGSSCSGARVGCDGLTEALQRRVRDRDWETGAFVVGGTALVGVIVTAIVGKPHAQRARAWRVVPTIGSASMGASFSGGF